MQPKVTINADPPVYIPLASFWQGRIFYHVTRDCPKWPNCSYFEWPRSRAVRESRLPCPVCATLPVAPEETNATET